MPLSHVSVWDPEVGYRRIKVEEACEMYPYEVPASSGQFVCELCAQSVGFSRARLDTGTRYFFHSSAVQDKTCEDRQTQIAKTSRKPLTSLSSHTMPLRISVAESMFSLQIGFFHIPDDRAHCDKIRITGNLHRAYEYAFERIEENGTTYLDVGSVPGETYNLEYINANAALKKYWSEKITVVNPSGSFFDGQSGQMLRSSAKAYAGNSYYLLQRCPLDNYPADIQATLIAKTQENISAAWYLYEVSIQRFSDNAARFFLRYSISLTEKPTRFYPVWPVYVRYSYFIYHNAREVYIYLCGRDSELKAYPAAANVFDAKEGSLWKISAGRKEQLISVGTSGALGFSYLIKKPLTQTAPLPAVTISDHDGEELQETRYEELPKFRYISVLCPYDGKAVVKRNGKTEYIYRLNAGHRLTIDSLSYGMEIAFYQGCDYIRSICFEQEEANLDLISADEALVKALKACAGPLVPMPHTAGALAGKFAACPQTKKWIYAYIRKGEISRAALHVLTNAAQRTHGRNDDDRG